MPRDLVYQVDSRCELLAYLMSRQPSRPRKWAKDLLRFGAVTVPGKMNVRHDTQLVPGDVVRIAARDARQGEQPELQGLKIVHLDDAIVVIDKAAGLLSMGSGAEKQKTAHRILNEYLKTLVKADAQQAFIVHRLDRETSGLIIFARRESIQAALQREWKRVTKKYLAVVEGALETAQGTLRDNLLETSSLLVRRVNTGGELAITRYRVLETQGNNSLLELILETGRKHQIRVQLASMGHPIVGDPKYGARTDPARRLALHSYALSFCHPVTGAMMEFRSALPQRLRALVDRRRLRG
ncbi:MAG: RluA family pseudouridine synthase [Candidatus Binataceae bacterium]